MARVCKSDRGGPNKYKHSWTTFLKSRLNCSLPGEYPFYFDHLRELCQKKGNKLAARANGGTETNVLGERGRRRRRRRGKLSGCKLYANLCSSTGGGEREKERRVQSFDRGSVGFEISEGGGISTPPLEWQWEIFPIGGRMGEGERVWKRS